LEIALKIGASFAAFTVRTNDSTSCKFGVPLSFAVNAIVVVPVASATGFIVAVQFGTVPPNMIEAPTTTAGVDDVADKWTAEQVTKLSTSLKLKLRTSVPSSATDCAVIDGITGASFTGVTVKLAIAEFEVPPISVIV
jgi:hypothetical protein